MAAQGYDPEVWLRDRFEIFRKFCFPSIINQSSKNFTWMIYLDIDTNPQVLANLKEMVRPYPSILLILRVFDYFSIRLFLNKDIHEYLSNDFEYLISSRVDTDDMLHKDYIKLVQTHFKNQKYEALNFNRGHIYDIETGVTSVTIHKQNPFISLFEKKSAEGFKTVFHQIHTSYRNDPLKIEISNKTPMWCMSVHGLNVSTGFYGSVFKFKQPNLGGLFGFSHQHSPTLQNIWLFTIRSYKRTILRVLANARYRLEKARKKN
ncbi:MAG: glycosyltransferase [Anditalea sp.]